MVIGCGFIFDSFCRHTILYLFFFPDGGYKGGRNPYYGIQIIFERDGWEWLHTWISLGMIVMALLHLIFHWRWVLNTFKRIGRTLIDRKRNGNRASWNKVLVNGIMGFSFLVCMVSGIYFLLAPDSKGGFIEVSTFLFSTTVWDLIHTWSGILFSSSALIHFVIHWGWVIKVSRKLFKVESLVSEQKGFSISN